MILIISYNIILFILITIDYLYNKNFNHLNMLDYHTSIIYSKYLPNINSIPNIKSYKTWVKSDYILFPLNVWQPHLESLFEQTCRRRQYDINLYFYALSKFNTTKGLSSPITSKLLRGDLLNAHQINNYVLQFPRIICILLSKILTLNWVQDVLIFATVRWLE